YRRRGDRIARKAFAGATPERRNTQPRLSEHRARRHRPGVGPLRARGCSVFVGAATSPRRRARRAPGVSNGAVIIPDHLEVGTPTVWRWGGLRSVVRTVFCRSADPGAIGAQSA